MSIYEAFESDRIWKQDIERGSLKLLAALWREHPAIMRALGAQQL